MLDAGVLTAAFTLLTARPDPAGTTPGQPGRGIPPGTVPPAIPSSWRPASPALAARVARARDPWLRPADRLRHATTLPVPARQHRARPAPLTWPPPARPGCPTSYGRTGRSASPSDPASSSHDKFLPAALIALLLPHSGMPLNQVTAMVSGQLRRHVTGYHMSKLTPARCASSPSSPSRSTTTASPSTTSAAATWPPAPRSSTTPPGPG